MGKMTTLLCATLITFAFGMGSGAYGDAAFICENSSSMNREELSASVVRLHILANSDKTEDQELKIKLRDALIEEYEDVFLSFSSKEEATSYIEKNIEAIEKRTNELLSNLEKANDCSARVVFGRSTFPLRTYGSLRLPEGEYDALRVTIGQGKGKNWWCVLYPPLCLVNVKGGQGDSEPKDNDRIMLKSRIVELLKELFQK